MCVRFLLFSCLCLVLTATWPHSALADVTLVYAASMPEIADQADRGGLPALASLLDETRQSGPCVFVFGGASLGPSMLSSLDKGAHFIDLLNLMEPDVMQISKREFIFQEDELTMRSSEAFFPMLASNLLDPRTGGGPEGVETQVLIDKDGERLGFLALLGGDLLRSYPPRYLGLRDEADNASLLRAGAARLREAGARHVILLTDFAWAGANALLEEGVLDLVMANGEGQSSVVPTKKGLYVTLNQDGSSAVSVRLPDLSVSFSALNAQLPNPLVAERLGEHLAQIEEILNMEIGSTLTEFDTLRANVRVRESAFASFVTDAMRRTLGADLAVLHGGSLRGDREYPAGTLLTRRDLRRELPFQDELILLQVSGQTIFDVLENGFSRIERRDGRFLHVSGMKVAYRPGNTPGSRLVSVETPQGPLDAERLYSLVVTKYLADGGDEYGMLLDAPRLPAQAVMLYDVVRQAFSETGSIAPVLDQRLLALP